MNIRRPLVGTLSLLACACLTVPVSSQDPTRVEGPIGPPTADVEPTQLATRIGAYLAGHHAHRQFDGTALVADDGKIVYQGAFGLANADWNLPNRLDTKFRIGAITKQFTAMLVLLLVEDGKLELDAPIGRYLPQLPAESGSKVTIHHLLNFTSGIPRFRSRPGWERDLVHRLPVEEFVARFCSGPLEFEPGTEFRHNNSGYYLLGAIVEAVTGQTYARALRERVLGPLQMDDTGLDDQDAVLRNRATGYEEVVGERHIAPWTEMSNLFASDGLYSTVGDLWKWDQALRSGRLLSGGLEQRMFTPAPSGYGYGWHIDRRGIWHGSFNIVPLDSAIRGFQALIGRLPSRGRCVILLSNSGFSPVADATLGIAQILDGGTPEAPAPRPASSLAQRILDDGVEAALAALAELPQSIRETPRQPPGEVESAIDRLGHRLLERRRVTEAVLLFEFNARAFPTSAQRWDSLGEAQLRAGRRQLAIESFRKVLELEPWNAAAKARLEGFERG